MSKSYWRFLALPILGCSILSANADAQTNFGSVNVGSSATETVTVAVPSAAIFTKISVLTMGVTALDFTASGTGTCAINVAYAANQTCTVGVTFKPLYGGLRKGAVTLSNSSTGVYATTFVYGIGNGPQLAFVAAPATAFSPTFNGYPPTLVKQALGASNGIAVDGAGTVYIASPVDNQSGTNIASAGVLQIPAGGTVATLLPALGSQGDSAPDPTAVRVDGAGDRIINDGYGVAPTISIPPGASLGTEYIAYTDVNAPAVDGAGDLFIYYGAPFNYTLSEYLGGNPADQESVPSVLYYIDPPADEDAEPLYFANAIAVDAAGDVDIATGKYVVEIPNPDPGGPYNSIQPLNLGSAADLAFDGAGDLLIADPSDNRVVEVQASTGTAFAIDPVVDGKGLSYPDALAFDNAGNLYIFDAGNARVVELHTSQPPALTFATTGVGAISSDSPQIVQLQNVGSSPLTFSSIEFPSDFPGEPPPNDGANHCGLSAPLAPGEICNLYINFLPQTEGDLTESVKITPLKEQGEPGITQDISVSGTGTGVLVSTQSLSYGSQEVGTPSASQQFTVTNYASTPLTLVGFPITGPDASSFVFGSNCGATLAPGASCIIHGHFTPTTTGPRTAMLHVEHHDAGPAQLIILSGTGLTPPVATLSGTNLSFGSQAVGTSSASQEITLTNTGEAALAISGISTSGPDASSFIIGYDCPGSLAGGASCTIHGHFTPATTGPLTATIIITDHATGSPQTITLTGTGQ